jgi:hypothetical protein
MLIRVVRPAGTSAPEWLDALAGRDSGRTDSRVRCISGIEGCDETGKIESSGYVCPGDAEKG